MLKESRTWRFGSLLWVLIVLVIGLLGYVLVRGLFSSPSLLDEPPHQDERSEVQPKELPVKEENRAVVAKEVSGEFSQGELDPLFAVLAGPGADQAAGLRLVGYDGSYADQLVAYVKRMSLMRKNPSLHRSEGTALLVIEQSPLGFEEIVELAGHLGKVENKDEKIKFIEVRVDKSRLESPPQPAVLLNPANNRYVEANIQELSKLDNRRIAAAARRLASVDPSSMKTRREVSARMVHLLNDPWGNDADYVRSLALALAVWASPQDEGAFGAISSVVVALGAARLDIPDSCLEFVAKGDPTKALAVLEPLWKADSSKLEEFVARAGSSAEDRFVATLVQEDTPDELRCSAIRLLGEIGSEKSVPVLEALTEDKNDSVKLFAEGALRSIRKRKGAL